MTTRPEPQGRRSVLLFAALLVLPAMLAAQDVPGSGSHIGISAGMGVAYMDAKEVVDMINGAFAPAQRLGQFHAGVDFFGAVTIPVSEQWGITAEYAYELSSYNTTGLFGPGEYTIMLHLPTLVLQYRFVDERYFNVSAGAGLGYHIGTLAIKYATIDAPYTAGGPGMVIALTGNTALGEDLFVHLAGNLRWEFIGDVRNSAGQSPGVNATGEPVSLHAFSIGARIGMTYYL